MKINIIATTVTTSVLTLIASTSNAALTEWRISDGGNGHYYDVVVTPLQTWVASKAQAESMGGYLASIRSASENSWIWTTFNIGGTSAYWANTGPYPGYDGPVFGAYRSSTNPQWTWVSGEAWDYSNWGWSAGPGEAGAQFIANSSAWDDIGVNGGTSAGGNVSFVIEYDSNPVPAPASIAVMVGLLCNRCRRRC
jgi:hypothetical protein